MNYRTPLVRRAPVELSELDEPGLKELAEEILRPYFHIEKEVVGVFKEGQPNVKIDYLLKPGAELVESGFVDQWIGLEVKALNDSDSKKHALAYAHQCICYSIAEFTALRDTCRIECVRPAFVVMFLPFRQVFEEDNRYMDLWDSFLMRFNVGSLHVNHYRTYEWRMVFGGQSYYSNKYGLTNQPQAALKRRVGNSK